MFCPVCKCEYVSGIKECPDCKVSLVESLEESDKEEGLFTEAPDESDLAEEEEELLEEEFNPYMGEVPDEALIREILERRKMIEEIPVYKSKAAIVSDNRSGAFALILCGVIGCFVLLFSALGIINLPISGFSMVSTYVIMGLLFAAFLVSGIISLLKVIKLAPELEKEKQNIDEVYEHIKNNLSSYKATEGLEKEEAYLERCAMAVKDVENAFPDLEPGFAYYVVDHVAGDLLDED